MASVSEKTLLENRTTLPTSLAAQTDLALGKTEEDEELTNEAVETVAAALQASNAPTQEEVEQQPEEQVVDEATQPQQRSPQASAQQEAVIQEGVSTEPGVSEPDALQSLFRAASSIQPDAQGFLDPTNPLRIQGGVTAESAEQVSGALVGAAATPGIAQPGVERAFSGIVLKQLETVRFLDAADYVPALERLIEEDPDAYISLANNVFAFDAFTFLPDGSDPSQIPPIAAAEKIKELVDSSVQLFVAAQDVGQFSLPLIGIQDLNIRSSLGFVDVDLEQGLPSVAEEMQVKLREFEGFENAEVIARRKIILYRKDPNAPEGSLESTFDVIDRPAFLPGDFANDVADLSEVIPELIVEAGVAKGLGKVRALKPFLRKLIGGKGFEGRQSLVDAAGIGFSAFSGDIIRESLNEVFHVQNESAGQIIDGAFDKALFTTAFALPFTFLGRRFEQASEGAGFIKVRDELLPAIDFATNINQTVPLIGLKIIDNNTSIIPEELQPIFNDLRALFDDANKASGDERRGLMDQAIVLLDDINIEGLDPEIQNIIKTTSDLAKVDELANFNVLQISDSPLVRRMAITFAALSPRAQRKAQDTIQKGKTFLDAIGLSKGPEPENLGDELLISLRELETEALNDFGNIVLEKGYVAAADDIQRMAAFSVHMRTEISRKFFGAARELETPTYNLSDVKSLAVELSKTNIAARSFDNLSPALQKKIASGKDLTPAQAQKAFIAIGQLPPEIQELLDTIIQLDDALAGTNPEFLAQLQRFGGDPTEAIIGLRQQARNLLGIERSKLTSNQAETIVTLIDSALVDVLDNPAFADPTAAGLHKKGRQTYFIAQRLQERSVISSLLTRGDGIGEFAGLDLFDISRFDAADLRFYRQLSEQNELFIKSFLTEGEVAAAFEKADSVRTGTDLFGETEALLKAPDDIVGITAARDVAKQARREDALFFTQGNGNLYGALTETIKANFLEDAISNPARARAKLNAMDAETESLLFAPEEKLAFERIIQKGEALQLSLNTLGRTNATNADIIGRIIDLNDSEVASLILDAAERNPKIKAEVAKAMIDTAVARSIGRDKTLKVTFNGNAMQSTIEGYKTSGLWNLLSDFEKESLERSQEALSLGLIGGDVGVSLAVAEKQMAIYNAPWQPSAAAKAIQFFGFMRLLQASIDNPAVNAFLVGKGKRAVEAGDTVTITTGMLVIGISELINDMEQSEFTAPSILQLIADETQQRKRVGQTGSFQSLGEDSELLQTERAAQQLKNALAADRAEANTTR